MIALHFCLLFASWTASRKVHPHQSIVSSDHRLASLPQGLLPSTIPSNTVLINLLSSILQTLPKSSSFLCFIKSTTVQCLCTFFTSYLVTHITILIWRLLSRWSTESLQRDYCSVTFLQTGCPSCCSKTNSFKALNASYLVIQQQTIKINNIMHSCSHFYICHSIGIVGFNVPIDTL